MPAKRQPPSLRLEGQRRNLRGQRVSKTGMTDISSFEVTALTNAQTTADNNLQEAGDWRIS